jgi:hypothetical protein
MDGFDRTKPKGMVGVSKISVQSGTSHGGVVLPDGSIADVKLDLDTLERLSKVAREQYGLSGAVQHGASTLPDTAFHNFPKRETAEIHLATNFQNMLYDHLPDALRDEIYAWLRVNAAGERKATDSDEQFIYKTRKKALGPFKRRFWDLDAGVKETLAAVYNDKFGFLFKQLAIGDTAPMVAKYVKAPAIHRPQPDEATVGVAAAPDDPDAGE